MIEQVALLVMLLQAIGYHSAASDEAEVCALGLCAGGQERLLSRFLKGKLAQGRSAGWKAAWG